MSTPPQLVEHFFRHEYGHLVAALVRRVGVQHLAAIEDAAQSALMAALEVWTRGDPPGNPSAWLFRVAFNAVLDELRTGSRRGKILAQHDTEVPGTSAAGPEAVALAPLLPGEVRDDLLRMLFVACDDAIPPPAQLALALKTLCGFSIREIAHRLFASEASIYKRIGRARRRLAEASLQIDALTPAQMAERRPAVHEILYLMFTEGHLSSLPQQAIRRELCDEAIRLTTVLAEHPTGREPHTRALLALMHLHAARMGAREDPSIGLLLLEEQDRRRWDPRHIEQGLAWLARAAEGETFSRYHAEAGVAAEHCLAPTFADTRWDRVVACYDLLERAAPSPAHTLNRAIAIAQWKGPSAGLAVLQGMEPPSWLAGSYLWSAVLADLHRRCGHDTVAARHRTQALAAAPTPAIAALLTRRLGGEAF